MTVNAASTPSASTLHSLVANHFSAILAHGHEPCYADVASVTAAMECAFPGNTPSEIAGAIAMAKGLMSPGKVDFLRRMHEGIGLIIATGGGFALAWGIVQIIAYGVVTTTVTGMLWWKATAVTTLLGGPAGVATGILFLLGGLYYFSSTTSSRKCVLTAQKVLEKGIDAWERTQ